MFLNEPGDLFGHRIICHTHYTFSLCVTLSHGLFECENSTEIVIWKILSILRNYMNEVDWFLNGKILSDNPSVTSIWSFCHIPKNGIHRSLIIPKLVKMDEWYMTLDMSLKVPTIIENFRTRNKWANKSAFESFLKIMRKKSYLVNIHVFHF